VIGDAAPDGAMVDVRATHAKAANVDAIEPEERQQGREAPRWQPLHQLEYFVHVQGMSELVRRLVPPVPVVEVTRDDERRVARDEAFDPLAQALELTAAATRRQREMYAYAMERRVPARDDDFAVQKAAPLETMRGDILVHPVLYRKTRQDRVAVVAVVIDGVSAVGKVGPDRIRQELVLRFRRPLLVALGVALVRAEHFLQKDDVGAERAETVPQLVDHHPAVEER
jgi:hypothetical protein